MGEYFESRHDMEAWGTVDENRMVPRPGEWPKVRLMGT